ncbi:MAG: T9SS type A sorting domain-containing protein [Saprospiraceae bacterium]|nr:T9SS type A sorting domain-containing protein [Saprospiraceae bacterium]
MTVSSFKMSSVALWAMLLLVSNILSSQKGDYHWIMGYTEVIPIPDSLKNMYGTTRFDFNFDPVKIYRDDTIVHSFGETNTSYSDDKGSLFAYSNGMHMFNKEHHIMDGGDSLLYGPCWENFNYENHAPDGSAWQSGINFPQLNIILDYPGISHLLAVIQDKVYLDDRRDSFPTSLHLGIININANDGQGKMILKDSLFESRELNPGYLNAVRHGNGRDWWITSIDRFNRYIYVYLLSPSGIVFHHLHPTGQIRTIESLAQSVFSSDGSKYAYIENLYLNDIYNFLWVYDFDRSTGNFSQKKQVVINRIGSFVQEQGMAISPDSRYMYAGNGKLLYQYDLYQDDLEKSKKLVAVYDDFKEFWGPTFSVSTYFSWWLLAPDGKLYGCSPAGSNLHWHRMEYPEEAGEKCQVTQHAIRLPTFVARGTPNYPNYHLGPLDGSNCDTLGLNNHPIAKYRYEADTLNHLKVRFTDLSYYRPETWSWDFGDDSPRVSTRHTYHSFKVNGTYNVCLTVSNENSVNTVCRTITIGTSSSEDNETSTTPDITLFPNPVEDMLLITIGEYIPEHGQLTVYDINGRQVISQRVYYGHNNVDMTQLPAGTYIVRIVDLGSAGKSILIREEKVVKIE